MKPPFLTEGRMITHSDLFRMLIGIPLGLLINSVRTSPEAFTRACSVSALSEALAILGVRTHRAATVR